MYYKVTNKLKGLLYYKPGKLIVPSLLPFDAELDLALLQVIIRLKSAVFETNILREKM